MKERVHAPPFSEEEWALLKRRLNLAPRQAELARHVLCGRSDKQIASEMGISIATVRTHLGRLLHRLGLSDRVELLLYLLARLRELNAPPLENSPQHSRGKEPH